MSEKIIHTECDCLWANDCFDEDCRKRWFLVNDVENSKFINIGICNQHLSLLINKEVMKHRNSWDANKRYIYSNIVEEIISNYINLGNTWGRNLNTNDLAEKSISFNICDRPFIYRNIKLLDCIELCLKNNSWELRNRISDFILNYLEDKTLYKKYKTKYKNTIILCKKLKRTYGKERENMINEIFINIIEMNTKQKMTRL